MDPVKIIIDIELVLVKSVIIDRESSGNLAIYPFDDLEPNARILKVG